MMRKPSRFLLLLVAAALIAAGGPALSNGLDPRTATFAPPHFEPPQPREAALTGGVRVFLLESREIPLVRLSLTFRGGSQIVSPAGAVLAAAPPVGDCVEVVEIDPAEADDKQLTPRNHVFGDRRPEHYD